MRYRDDDEKESALIPAVFRRVKCRMRISKPGMHLPRATTLCASTQKEVAYQQFLLGVPASRVAQRTQMRRPTLVTWFAQRRGVLAKTLEDQRIFAQVLTPDYIWVRRKPYPQEHAGTYVHRVALAEHAGHLYAWVLSLDEQYATMPVTSVREAVRENNYHFHKKNFDDILIVKSVQTAHFFGSVAPSIRAFVGYAKQMIKKYHGIPTSHFPHYLAERTVRYRSTQHPHIIDELLLGCRPNER